MTTHFLVITVYQQWEIGTFSDNVDIKIALLSRLNTVYLKYRPKSFIYNIVLSHNRNRRPQ